MMAVTRFTVVLLLLWMTVAVSLPAATTVAQNETVAPTATVPTSIAPTLAPAAAPTKSPAPTTRRVPTAHPSHHYTPPGNETEAPSSAPAVLPPPKHNSIGRVIGKTIGWLFLIALSVLCFGAIMSNRYRIYYALRGVSTIQSD